MKKKERSHSRENDLRKRAEESYRKKSSLAPDKQESSNPGELQQILYELRVHQIELEMQNDELRRAQGELEASRARYFDLYDLAPVGYLSLNENGLITEINLTAATLLGMARGELIKQPVSRFIHKEDQDIYYRHRKELMETGTLQVYELRMTRNDGTTFWVQVQAVTAHDAEGLRVYRVVVIDIDERKLLEEALDESQRQITLMADLLDHSSQAFSIFYPDGRLGRCNEAFPRMMGYTKEELSALDWIRDITSPEWLELERLELERLQRTGLPVRYEKEYIRKDGTRVPAELLVHMIRDEQDRLLYYYGFATDITERKLAEDKILQLLSEKELLLREVHHRIKNNMYNISTLLDLQADLIKNTSAVVALRDAKSRVRSMMVLYDKVYRSTNLEKIAIGDYLPSLVDDIITSYSNKNLLTVETHIGAFTLDVDRAFPLGMILNELLINALKHAFVGRDDGMIIVSASLTGNRAAFIIEDNGVGMPESIDIETSTGFGMHLVNALVKQLGGNIRIERGKGTRLVLEFDAL
ncbi:MAG: PAS domain S-box protein [Spirochaetes bacterium]|nr:PAS domain S-box protein [Spirochaetota bacterium]